MALVFLLLNKYSQRRSQLKPLTEDHYQQNGITRTPLGGFGNHSDTPNCFKVKLEYDNSWIGAIRDIEPNEEITWKYTLYEIV